MNSITKIAGVLAVLATSAFAQTEQVSATETETGGLIGKKYVAAGFGYLDVKHSNQGVFGTGLEVNVPVNSIVDINTSFTHAWAENTYVNAQDLNLSAISYLAQGNVKPFVEAGLSYAWTGDDSEGLRYNVGVGAEYTFSSKLALRVSADYVDGFRRRTQSTDEFSGTVGLNYWATKNVFVGGDVTLSEGGDVGYTVSVGLRF